MKRKHTRLLKRLALITALCLSLSWLLQNALAPPTNQHTFNLEKELQALPEAHREAARTKWETLSEAQKQHAQKVIQNLSEEQKQKAIKQLQQEAK